MNRLPRIKVCGLTRARDIAAALECGADFCGVIIYKKSPRGVGMARARKLAESIPPKKRVLVAVNPSPARLERYCKLGFGAYQLHFDLEKTPLARIAQWSKIAGKGALWLAPKLKRGAPFPEELLKFARTFLVDSSFGGAYGGTGRTGDWAQFARLMRAHPGKRWILAGGLSPRNVRAALAKTRAQFVDVNSGVESLPGEKDAAKISAFFKAAGRPPRQKRAARARN